jgi:hypothetical protein
MRGKVSPTVAEMFLDRHWWMKRGGGYGLMTDGSSMSDSYHRIDHNGYDQFGYNVYGKDRAGHTVRDYEHAEELFYEISMRAGTYFRGPGKTASEYWSVLRSLTERLADLYPELPVFEPQHGAGDAPGIYRLVDERGVYSVKALLSPEAGMERSYEIRLDDGTGGPRRIGDTSWTFSEVVNAGGETRRYAACLVDDLDGVLAEFRHRCADWNPRLRIHDIVIAETGAGKAYLAAVARTTGAVPPDGIGTVYADDAVQALEQFSTKTSPGGALERFASRGLRIALEASQDMTAPYVLDHIEQVPDAASMTA